MIIDGHADTLSRLVATGEGLKINRGHFDLTRARQSGIALQVLALYTPERESHPAWDRILEQIKYFKQQMEDVMDLAFPVTSLQDMERYGLNTRTGLMLHLEGGEALGNDLNRLTELFELGVRSIGLTWNYRNLIAAGVLEPDDNEGLSPFGREVVKELNRLRMAIDLAHISPTAFYDVIDLSSLPPYVSHANAYHLCPHPRNLTDHQLKMLRDAGGIIGVTFVKSFIAQSQATSETLIDHISYIMDMIGADFVALGSDFDGTDDPVISDVSGYPALIEQLKKRGFYDQETKKLTTENYLNYIKATI
jgi:membrane dipeptidase